MLRAWTCRLLHPQTAHEARQARRWWCASACLVLIVLLVSVRYTSSVSYAFASGERWLVGLGGGRGGGGGVLTLQCSEATHQDWFFGTGHMDLAGTGGLGVSVSKRWEANLSLAWRPYHTAVDAFPASSDHHGLAVPLWPVAVVSMLMLGRAQGVGVGVRAARGACVGCGYLRAGLAPEATCPECGLSGASRGGS